MRTRMGAIGAGADAIRHKGQELMLAERAAGCVGREGWRRTVGCSLMTPAALRGRDSIRTGLFSVGVCAFCCSTRRIDGGVR